MTNQQHGQRFLAHIADVQLELPFSADILRDLYTQTADASLTPLELIAGTISRDQGLTARVLTVANSAYYGLASQVTSVTRALSVLGLREVRTIVLSLGVASLADEATLPDSFDLPTYWEHQLRVAMLAQRLAPACQPALDGDDCFTAGLLHDLGKLVIGLHAPADYETIVALMTERDIPFSEAEETYWGLDHGVIGALVLASWNLPPSLSEPVNWHHSPFVESDHQQSAALINLCDALTHAHNGGAPDFADWRETAALLSIPEEQAHTEAEAVKADEQVCHFVQLFTPSTSNRTPV